MSKISSEARGHDTSILVIFHMLILFFRLFSKFTISATAQQYIRVCSATLENAKDDKELSISSTLSQTREIIVRPHEYGIAEYHSHFIRPSPLRAPHIFYLSSSHDMIEVRSRGHVADGPG